MHDHLSDLMAPGAARLHACLAAIGLGGKRRRKVGPPAGRNSREGRSIGKRVLLVEDEFLVALEIEQILREHGYEIVASVPDIEGALRAVGEGGFDAAVLDISLGGLKAYPVADALHERGIPFLFATGYGAADIPPRYRNLPHLQKPFDAIALVHTIKKILSGAH